MPEELRPRGRADTKLLERAVKDRWPIPEEMRKAIIDRQCAIATAEDVSPREATSAAKTVIMADRLNQQEEQGPKTEQHQHLHLHGAELTDEERLRRMRALLRRVKERTRAGGTGGVTEALPADDA